MRGLLISDSDNMPVTGTVLDAAPDPLPQGARYELVPFNYPGVGAWVPSGGVNGPGGICYPDPPALLTVGRFKLLLTQDERIAFRTAAASNPQVEDFLDLLAGFTEGVSLTDPFLVTAITQMKTAGLLTDARAAAVLAGDAP
jgi:hypothetical protein